MESKDLWAPIEDLVTIHAAALGLAEKVMELLAFNRLEGAGHLYRVQSVYQTVIRAIRPSHDPGDVVPINAPRPRVGVVSEQFHLRSHLSTSLLRGDVLPPAASGFQRAQHGGVGGLLECCAARM